MIVANLDLTDTDVVGLARAVLGYRLCTNLGGQLTSGIIVETEAYRAPEDKASHAYNGRKTARTNVIYRPGGVSYVYLCYGIHHLFNIVSGPKDVAHAILVRALQPESGIEFMRERRGQNIRDKQLTNGPGKLSQALDITLQLNDVSLNRDSGSNIWIEPGMEFPDSRVIRSKRIGVDYADEWKEKLWRFHVAGNPYVSVK